MKKAILGKKLGMTQIFTEKGSLIPVTVILSEPNVVLQKKDVENDGYEAIQVGIGEKKGKHTPKPMQGHFEKANASFKRYVREFRIDDWANYNVGDEIKVDIFASGEIVDVTGTSKGKGYAGTIKRWGTHRGPMTHGSKYHRGPGSLGAASDPSRVYKGKKLPGHLGNVTVTIQNLSIVKVDTERNLLLIKGAVPGPKGGLVTVKNAARARV